MPVNEFVEGQDDDGTLWVSTRDEGIKSDVFDGIDYNIVTLYIPEGSLDAYHKHPAFSKFKKIKIESVPPYSQPNDPIIYSENGKTMTGVHDKAISSIKIPDSVENINEWAFSGCLAITAIMVPEGVKVIGKGAFSGCPNLESIQVVPGNTVYDSRDNCNAIIESATDKLIAGCRNTVIPQGVTAIGRSAFAGCSKLTSITIPDSVTQIERGALERCCGLKEIHFHIRNPNRLAVSVVEFDSVNHDECVLYVPKGSEGAYRGHPAFHQFKTIKPEAFTSDRLCC